MQLSALAMIGAAIFLIGGATPASRAQDAAPTGVLFENVRIFDGSSERLSGPSNVLVVGNTIQRISTAPIVAPPGTVVSGSMPAAAP